MSLGDLATEMVNEAIQEEGLDPNDPELAFLVALGRAMWADTRAARYAEILAR